VRRCAFSLAMRFSRRLMTGSRHRELPRAIPAGALPWIFFGADHRQGLALPERR
jgi:hypothetical protein